MRHGDAEYGHHRIADVFLDSTAVAFDRGTRDPIVPLVDRAQRLRVEPVESSLDSTRSQNKIVTIFRVISPANPRS